MCTKETDCICCRGAFPALPLWSLSPAWPGRFCAPSWYIKGLSPDYSTSLRSTLLEVTLPGHSPVPRSTDGAGDARLRGGGQMVCSPSCGGQGCRVSGRHAHSLVGQGQARFLPRLRPLAKTISIRRGVRVRKVLRRISCIPVRLPLDTLSSAHIITVLLTVIWVKIG